MEKKKKIKPHGESLFDAEISGIEQFDLMATGNTIEEADANLTNAIVKDFLSNKQAIKTILDAPDRKQVLWELLKAPEDRVPDEDFFKFIQEEPQLLGSRFAQEKIYRWRRELLENDQDRAYRAKGNLERIGKALAFKGQKKPRIPKTFVALEKHRVLAMLLDDSVRSRYKENTYALDLPDAFASVFGHDVARDIELVEELTTWVEGVSAKECARLANLITAKILGLKVDVVENYSSAAKITPAKDGQIILKLKKPRQ